MTNDCEYYKNKLFTTRYILDLKSWARGAINAEEARIEDYSIDAENEEAGQYADKEAEKIGRGRGAEEGSEEIYDADEEGDRGRALSSECQEYREGDDLRSECDPECDDEVTEYECDLEGEEEEPGELEGELGSGGDGGADSGQGEEADNKVGNA